MDHPKAMVLAKILAKYDLRSSLSYIAGLATVPCFLANSYRIELLTELIVSSCEGKRRISSQHLSHWLNNYLGVFDIVSMEDPAEDVFVVNVLTREGDFRVLNSLWEAGDSGATLLIETLEKLGKQTQKTWLRPVLALLRLSDAMLERSGLPRWHSEPSHAKGVMEITPATPLKVWARRTIFRTDELNALGLDPNALIPFVFDLDGRKNLLAQSNQESDLHRTPLLRFGDEYVVALPNAITYAIRMYLLGCAIDAQQIGTLQCALMINVQRRLIQMVRLGSRHLHKVVELPPEVRGVQGLCQSVAIQVSGRRFLHFLLVSDDIREMASAGLLHPSQLPPSAVQGVVGHIESLRDHLESQYQVDSGHTFWLMGHLGQGFVGNPPSDRPLWTFQTARLNDLEMLFRDPHDPADRLILLMNQEKQFANEGLELPFQNGLLNLYAFWLKQDFCLRIPDISHDQGAYLQIGTDFITEYRTQRRTEVDEHCEPTLHEGPVVVQLANANAIYKVLRSIPAYASLNHLAAGILSFCLKHYDTTLWLTVLAPSSGQVRESAFMLWDSLQLLLNKILLTCFKMIRFQFPVVEATIDLRHVKEVIEEMPEPSRDVSLRVVWPVQNSPSIWLVAAPGFLHNFSEIENKGEQLLLTQLIRALTLLADTTVAKNIDPSEEALNILEGTAARVLHTFRMHHDVDYLLSTNSRKVYRVPTEHMRASMNSAFTWMPPPQKPILFDRTESVRMLNAAVGFLAERLAGLLKRFDRIQLIKELLHLHETLLRERTRWRYTARAVRALYGLTDGTSAAAEVEQERAELQIAIRALVEAAVCECPAVGGTMPDEYSVDELVGVITTLNHLGRGSDIIYYGLASKGITLYPNGSYSHDADVLGQLAGLYFEESFGVNYKRAAANYEGWVGLKQEKTENETESVFASASFLKAWQMEYGLSFEAFREITSELQDLGVKRSEVVVKTTAKDVAAARADAGVTINDVQAFIGAFGLLPRRTWVAQPPESRHKDINPWRFQRRLSLSLRPVVVCQHEAEQEFVYGVGALQQSFVYVLDSIQDGTFDKDVFMSTEMRSFLGARIDSLGRRFTERVAVVLRKEGWMTTTEIKLTQLGASKSPNLGDIDVLAWHDDGRVLAIECKRLKESRTIAEIALACDRFKGNVDDHLYRHLRRATWLQAHICQISKFTRLPEASIRIRNPLVVSRPVPFKYLEGLPIPTTEIISFENLGNYLLSTCSE